MSDRPARRHRARTALIVVLVLLVGLAIAADFIVRDRVSAALDDASADLPDGTTVALDGSPVLWQLATGGFAITATADDAALTALIAQRTGLAGTTVDTTDDTVQISAPITVLTASVTLAVTLEPTVRDGALELDPTTVSIGDLTSSVDDARQTLAQVGGGASTLLDPIRIPDDGSFTVADVDVSAAGATVRARVPLATALDLAD